MEAAYPYREECLTINVPNAPNAKWKPLRKCTPRLWTNRVTNLDVSVNKIAGTVAAVDIPSRKAADPPPIMYMRIKSKVWIAIPMDLGTTRAAVRNDRKFGGSIGIHVVSMFLTVASNNHPNP